MKSKNKINAKDEQKKMAGIPTCIFGADQGKLLFLFDTGGGMIENVLL